MLKPEKIAKTAQIGLVIRPKESLLNSLFLKSLLIAICLHLVAGALIKIRSNLVLDNTFISPPLVVDTDTALSLSAGDIITGIDADEWLSYPISKPPEAELDLPLLSMTIQAARPDFLQKDSKLPLHLISGLFQEMPAFVQDWLTGPSQQKFFIEVSGPLQAKTLLTDGLEKLHEEGLKGLKAAYEVRLETSTGKLFWFNLIEGTPSAKLEQRLEKVLKTMKFEPEPYNSVIAGVVSISY